MKNNDRFPYYKNTVITMANMKSTLSDMKTNYNKTLVISSICNEVIEIMKTCPYNFELTESLMRTKFEFNRNYRTAEVDIPLIEKWIENNVDIFVEKNFSILTKIEYSFCDVYPNIHKTKDESIVYDMFKLNRIIPIWQYQIGKRIADFVFKEEKIVIELDGPGHWKKKDVERNKYYKNRGWTVITIKHKYFMNKKRIEKMVEKICEIVELKKVK